jgi:uroporphyrinogen-III synthase
MRVVVTRPERSGQKTASLLQSMGHVPVLLPLTKPLHHTDVALTAMSTDAAPLVVTSAEAVRVLVSLGDKRLQHMQRVVFAVGEATAIEARLAGFANVIAADGDGASLAALIVQNRHLLPTLGTPLVYLAGKPRSPGFEEAMENAGVTLQVTECYEMQPLQWSDGQLSDVLLSEQVGAVLFYSAEAVRLFFEKAQADKYVAALRNTRFVCISDKVAALVPQPFRAHTVASDTPNEAAVLALLANNAGT